MGIIEKNLEVIERKFRDYRREFKTYWREFKDYREEFREFASRTDENFRIILEKYGEISRKLTEILETFRRESIETRKILHENIELAKKLIEKMK